jgi:uncharacterized membrane protein (UPF0127 family)
MRQQAREWRARRALLLLVVLILTSWAGAPSGLALPRHQDGQLATIGITVGGVPLTVELAVDPADHARGLSGRDHLAPGAGMLFVFPEPAPRSFWMKEMRFCLDIVWIENDVIQGAAQGVCPAAPGTAESDLPSYASPVPVSYVLEVPAGWLAAHGLGAGALVEGLPRLQPAAWTE